MCTCPLCLCAHDGPLQVTDRGLNPANILVLSDCQLRITDFGLARKIKPLSSTPEEDEGKGGQVDNAHLTECEKPNYDGTRGRGRGYRKS